jgi:alpha-beta hydrolase superfamily lysophospholipase
MSSVEGRATARDGTSLLTRHWPAVLAASDRPRASVLLVHGLAEHSGRYEQVGSWLADAGFDVRAWDQRGFGASGGRRAWVRTFGEYHDDLAERLAAIRSSAEGRVVLYGHSLGGLIALGYVLADRPKPDALVLSAPALVTTIPAWKRALARLLGRVAPMMLIANGLRGDQLSRDPEVGRRYFADPLNEHRSTAAFGAAALAELVRVQASLERLALPTYVLHGSDDTIVPVAASERLSGQPGVTRRVWPGLRHEMHNEPEGAAVVAELVTWLGRPGVSH